MMMLKDKGPKVVRARTKKTDAERLALLKQKDGIQVILGGSNGNLYIEPEEADVRAAQKIQAILADQRDSEYRTRFEPASGRK